MPFTYKVWIGVDNEFEEEIARVPHLEEAFEKTQYIPREGDKIEVYAEDSIVEVDFKEVWVDKEGKHYLQHIKREYLSVESVYINLMTEVVSVYF